MQAMNHKFSFKFTSLFLCNKTENWRLFSYVFSQSVVSDWATLWTVALQAPLPLGFPSKNIGVECHFFLQGILLTPGIEPVSLCPLLWHVNSATWEIFKDITNAELWQSPHILRFSFSKLIKTFYPLSTSGFTFSLRWCWNV